MRHLYQKYGKDFVLLDATYKTCRYALPLFFLVVRTNINYQVVGIFITQEETSDAIKEALLKLREMTPDVTPRYGMVDFSEPEIKALESTFPGMKNYYYNET